MEEREGELHEGLVDPILVSTGVVFCVWVIVIPSFCGCVLDNCDDDDDVRCVVSSDMAESSIVDL